MFNRNTRLMSFIFVCALFLLANYIQAHAGTFTAFGPKAFVRGTAKPVIETATFNIAKPTSTYVLHVYNGGQNSEYSKVSSAIIKLNGSTAFDTNDFNQQVTHLQKNVSVAASNALQVELRSSPKSGLTITIEESDVNADTTPPVISIDTPINGVTVYTSPITVIGSIDDNTATVTVNGKNATVSSNKFTATGITLSGGTNTINLTAKDPAGNTSTASINVIYIQDTTPPAITITSPANGATVDTSSITVSGTIDDNTATVTVNGINVPISNGAFTSNVTLTEGTNLITVSATDQAGNTSTAIISVTYKTSIRYTNPGAAPDLTVVAPPINPTNTTILSSAAEFLYTGSNPIQTGMAFETIEAKRIAVLRGLVLTK